MPVSSPKVSIVIPVFNEWKMTRQCLESLGEHTPADLAEVIMVDNGSTDETASQAPVLGKALLGARFTYNTPRKNLNFGPGCNFGAKQSNGEHILFLNNDTLVTDGWLPPLLDALATDSNLGAVGPLLLYPEAGTVQHLGVSFHVNLSPEHLYEHIPGDHPLAQRPRRMQAITAAALMLPRALFDDCGGFFPEYRNGFEDLELCARIRQRGLELSTVPASTVFHVASASQGRFDDELHNGELLRQRCADAFRPDYQQQLLDDGFDVRLTKAMEAYPCVPAGRAQELAAQCKDAGLEQLWDTVQDELFWEEGYDILAQQLEDTGHIEAAAQARYHQSLFMPHAQVLSRFAALAGKAGWADTARSAAEAASTIRQRETDIPPLKAAARTHAAHFEGVGNETLRSLYATFLASLEDATD